MPLSSSDPERIDTLKSALWLHVGRIVDDQCLAHSQQRAAAAAAARANTTSANASTAKPPAPINATPRFIGALTEMVWAQISRAAADSEGFARHAGRTTVQPPDVMLLARNSEGLQEVLKEKLQELEGAREDEKVKTGSRRGGKAGAATGTGTGGGVGSRGGRVAGGPTASRGRGISGRGRATASTLGKRKGLG